MGEKKNTYREVCAYQCQSEHNEHNMQNMERSEENGHENPECESFCELVNPPTWAIWVKLLSQSGSFSSSAKW